MPHFCLVTIWTYLHNLRFLRLEQHTVGSEHLMLMMPPPPSSTPSFTLFLPQQKMPAEVFLRQYVLFILAMGFWCQQAQTKFPFVLWKTNVNNFSSIYIFPIFQQTRTYTHRGYREITSTSGLQKKFHIRPQTNSLSGSLIMPDKHDSAARLQACMCVPLLMCACV